MKSCKCWLVLLGVLLVHNCVAVPVSNGSLDDELANSVEEEEEEEEDEDESLVLEDDFTTHGLERLSSAATCLVAGIEYTHGQQIYRKDPCEFCLCLDGEMFCWWQDCPPTLEGPCRDRGPFSPCLSIPANPLAFGSFSSLSSSSSLSSATSSSSTTAKVPAKVDAASSSSTVRATLPTLSSIFASGETDKTSSSYPTKSSVNYCTVMGKIYQVGDKLPHDTGNCLECICGQGAKVTCSPHQCAPVEDDINDFSARQQNVPDIF